MGARKEPGNSSANLHSTAFSNSAAVQALHNSAMHAAATAGNNHNNNNMNTGTGLNQSQSNRPLPPFGFDFSNFHNTY